MDDVLTSEECGRLIEAARSRTENSGQTHRHAVRDVLILRVMLECGLRASEVVQLQPNDVFAGATYLLVGAGPRRRQVPASEELTASLEEFAQGPERRDRVFDLSKLSVERMVGSYAALAGIQRPVRPFTLRRTFAQRAFPSQIPSLEALARALGVESTVVAARYLSHDCMGGEPYATS